MNTPPSPISQPAERSSARRVPIGLLAPTIALVLGAAVALSGARSTGTREWGWRCQAVALAVLAVGWLSWAAA